MGTRIKYHEDICGLCQGNLVEVFTKELAIPFSEVRFGGRNPMKEVSTGIFCRNCGLGYTKLPSAVSAWISTFEAQIEAESEKNRVEEEKKIASIKDLFASCNKIPPFNELCGGINLKE